MKRKILSLMLSSTMIFSNLTGAFANNLTKVNDSEQTYIETSIGFSYPETIDALKKKSVKAILTGNGKKIEVPLSDLLDNNRYVFNKDALTIYFERIEEEGKITSIKFKIDGLTPSPDYNLKLVGKNYAKTSIDLSTLEFSKRVNISTRNTMVLGDVNNDDVVDEKDLEILEQNLNTKNEQLDINGDGLVTAADISIVNHNIVTISKPVVLDTDMVPSKLVEKIDQTAITESVEIKEGSIQDLFKESEPVTLAPKKGEDKVSIPVTFDKPQEMSTVSVTLPDGTPEENVTIKVIDESGNIVDATKEFRSINRIASTFSLLANKNSNTTVSVNLGKRVPVKKVIIDVKPKEDGKGVVVVDKVSFLKDVVDESAIKDTKVKNIKVTELNKSVTLNWEPVENVIGYKIYYGTSRTELTSISETEETTITINELDNLTPYYFQVAAVSGDWEGERSNVVMATPQPSSAPLKPDYVSVTEEDATLSIKWKEAKDTLSYNVYIKKEGDADFTKIRENITETSTVITGLENGKLYSIHVTAVNNIGESPRSELAQGRPKKEDVLGINLPTRDRIPNSNIAFASIAHKDYYDHNLYPNGFKSEWLYDEDFNTSWVARAYWENSTITFDFKEAKDMDYLVWVPRLDGKFRNSLETYTITVWNENDDLTKPGKIITKGQTIKYRAEDNKYFTLTFPKQEKVKKIAISLAQWAGSPTNVSVSEVAFYEYNDIADRVDSIFEDSAKTKVAKHVTQELLESLEREVSDITGFVINNEYLLKEIDLAKKLLNGDNSALGLIKDNIYKIDSQNDHQRYGQVISELQPLGIVGRAREDVIIYADIPEGEVVNLIPTQYYEESRKWIGSPIPLTNGRNIVTIPKLGDQYFDRGGSLYVTYGGDKASQIKLQIFGDYHIPYLELKELHTMDESTAKAKIKAYIEHLEKYVPTLKGNLMHQNLNSTEISLPDVLLSIPASQVLESLGGKKTTIEQKVETLYDATLSWEEVLDIAYKIYGIDDHKKDGFSSRQNIRYMKMFADAFMYAAGNHIGVGYNETKILTSTKPTSKRGENSSTNGSFGWGVLHEIGHVLDKFGKAEVTNNLFPLIIQSYDGKNNILKSRIETNEGDSYLRAFNTVAVNPPGFTNDNYLQMIMYWQLHLAYGDADNLYKVYGGVNKLYRQGDKRLEGLEKLEKFAIASSIVVNKNLIPFFEKWGVRFSNQVKDRVKDLPEETRLIYYLSDESRRQMIAKNPGALNMKPTAKAEIDSTDPKRVNITITKDSNVDDKNIQGYEIIRNGKSIGFTKTNEYADVVKSANNMSFDYKIRPIDILGNPSPIVDAGSVRISYDKVIDRSLFTMTGTNAKFNSPTTITGIKLTPKEGKALPNTGDYTISVKLNQSSLRFKLDSNTVKNDQNIQIDNSVIAKSSNFSKNESKNSEAYVAYFNKPGDTADKLWTYDAKEVTINLPQNVQIEDFDVDFISYPGDDIELLEMGIGRLSRDYTYGNDAEDVIKAGTLVVVGNYRGNTVTNKVRIKGKFETSDPSTGNSNIEERPINGYTLMFDEVPESGKITSSTTQGLFIFVPDLQKEAELQESMEQLSILPIELKAEMFKVTSTGDLLTTDTLWRSMPSDETLPQIEINE